MLSDLQSIADLSGASCPSGGPLSVKVQHSSRGPHTVAGGTVTETIFYHIQRKNASPSNGFCDILQQ